MMTEDELDAWRPYTDVIIKMDDERLLTLLADQIGLGLGASEEESRRKLGRAWLNGHLASMKLMVCRSGVVSALKARNEKDIAMIVAALADVIVGSLNKPAAATVALLLARQGLDNICREND
ncbi:hypothetical protein [Actinoplanes sp. NPDC048796]|uniref:hypothetical protein n=1 Tax=Actinoplanes sp. NPDC048796 TaxID=3155640 RepID=UPI0033BFFE9E